MRMVDGRVGLNSGGSGWLVTCVVGAVDFLLDFLFGLVLVVRILLVSRLMVGWGGDMTSAGGGAPARLFRLSSEWWVHFPCILPFRFGGGRGGGGVSLLFDSRSWGWHDGCNGCRRVL